MRSLRSLEHKFEDNIKINLKEAGYEGVHWIYLTRGKARWWRLVNTNGHSGSPNSRIIVTS
jgi:hypothetical protein